MFTLALVHRKSGFLAFKCADVFNVKMPDSWVRNKAAGPVL